MMVSMAFIVFRDNPFIFEEVLDLLWELSQDLRGKFVIVISVLSEGYKLHDISSFDLTIDILQWLLLSI
jgi:hypothetical protein